MNGHIRPAFEQGDFQFFGEKAARQAGVNARHGRGLQFVAGGFDDFEGEGELGKFSAAFGQDHVRLGQGQRAAARGDENGLFGHALAWFIPERARLGVAHERPGLLADDGRAPGDFLLALAKVIVGNGLQIIDVVEVNVLQKIDGRINVARHGDVNEQQRPVAAQFHQWLQLRPVKNIMRRGRAADDDVNAGKFRRPILEMNRPPVQFPGQGHGAVMRAVGDNDAVGAAAEQGARGFLARLTRADDHDRMLVQRTENLLRQFHRHGADGHAAALDVGFRPNLLGHVERFLKGLVQMAAGLLVLQGRFVSLL